MESFSSETGLAVIQLIELLSIISFLSIAFVFSLMIYMRIKEKNRKLEELNKKEKLITETITQVQENERNRISRELHDTITQDIRTSLIFLHKLTDSNEINDEDRKVILKVQKIEENNLKSIRSIIRNLTSNEIENENFIQIISEFVENSRENSGILCKFYAEQSDLYQKLSSEVKLHIFRIIQESVTNAIKHSGAEEISVIIREGKTYSEKSPEKSGLIFLINDDGCGMQESIADEESTHLGLKGIKSRAAIIGAELEIKSNCETGTQIKLFLGL